ncbi:MAG: glycoside hydrolase family 3 C-terminal domain-containing protein [Butyrivibrio sp.]|nr:glycoside hydrolase family 3 C-terminal domain-containing protein [Butyrivibrio sp.]
MQINSFRHSGTTDSNATQREHDNRMIARKAAREGIVLLQNDGNVLPLLRGSMIALFGSGAGRTIKGGTGSGDVNERENISIYQGLINAGFSVSSAEWIQDYNERYTQARLAWKERIIEKAGGDLGSMRFFEAYASNAFEMPDGRTITQADVQGAETAIYVLSRIAGEGADRYEKKGDYEPTDHEIEDLETLGRLVKHIILILNVGGQVDLQKICRMPNIQAMLMIAQPGMEGGNAVADILSGEETPSGKLTDTWAVDYHDYPNADTFSHQNADTTTEKYEEGIYVGYRYFDSFAVKPMFPFGYGLSYTTFEVRGQYVMVNTERVQVVVTVTNTGAKYSGREVVQVYATCPQGGMPKEYKRLCAFDKTRLLAPGEKQTMTITFSAKALASFSEEKSAWIVEKGLYGIWIGNSSADIDLCGVLSTAEDAILEKVQNICPIQETLKEIRRPDDTAHRMEQAWYQIATQKRINAIPFKPAQEKKKEYQEDELDRLAAEKAKTLTAEQMIPLLIGEISQAQGALGAAGIRVPGAAGETSSALLDENIAAVSMADGPAGLRLVKDYEVDPESDMVYSSGMAGSLEGGFFAKKEIHPDAVHYYQYCTAFPVGTLLAQSWDTALLELVGQAVEKEMEELHIGWWLAPGMNIHRNPLCGRNFEYYSEDPLISGMMAAAMTKGVQSGKGVGTTIKHFACNNQEDNRMGSNSIVSERTLREIYLRGFEIAVKTAQPMAIMTSYNEINGVHSANNRDICTVAARTEWGFKGIIMTDWTTTFPDGGSESWECVWAGNDLIMPGYPPDAENIKRALEDGRLTEKEIRACAERMINVIYRTLSYQDAASYQTRF